MTAYGSDSLSKTLPTLILNEDLLTLLEKLEVSDDCGVF